MGINHNDFVTIDDADDIFVLASIGERLNNFGVLTTGGNLASPIRVAANGVDVANFGSLTTSGDGSRGITVGDQFGTHYDNVTVTNYGAITTTGNGTFVYDGTKFILFDFADGIDAYGDNNQVINFGTISATGFLSGGINTIGIDTLVVNYGTIESGFFGMIGEGSVPYFANGASGHTPLVDPVPSHNELINHGEIHLTGDPNGAGIGIAIMSWAGESIVRNYGTIVLDGEFAGFVDGIDVTYAGSLAENYGQIYATSGFATGMFAIFGDNLLRNYGTIQLDGTYSVGLLLDGANSRAENYGTVVVSDETSIGVVLGPYHFTRLTGGAEFTNYGTVATVSISVLGTPYDDVVTNHGALIGDVYLDAGDDTYVGGARGSLEGLLTLGDGDDLVVVERNSGDLVITDFTAGTDSDDAIDLGTFGFRSLAQVLDHASQSGLDVVLDLDRNTNIVLQNVSLASLSADDFVLRGPGNAAIAASLAMSTHFAHDLLLF